MNHTHFRSVFPVVFLILFALGVSHGESERQEQQLPGVDLNSLLWQHFLNHYAAGKDYLSAQDLATLVDNLRRDECDSVSSPPTAAETALCDKTILSQLPLDLRNASALASGCNKILYLLDNPSCCFAHHPLQRKKFQKLVQLNEINKKEKEKPTSAEAWGYGILCVTVISMSSLAGVSVMPFMKKEFYKHLLTGLVGLAVGSLTGSAVFHLLPQAFALADHDPTHDYLFISLVVCGGIWMFFMLERILKFIMGYKDRKDKQWNREKVPSIGSSTPENSTISVLIENGNLKSNSRTTDPSSVLPCSQSGPEVVYECQEQAIKASFGHRERPRLSSFHDHSVKFEQGKDSVIATVAYMIIFGDGLHNFIDGLSIGAAFNESILTGVSISVAVLCEELPHELGDFAVLLNAGMSMRQALTYNFLSACTCYVGMAVGIFLGEIEASTYIFALAGGMFLYIALVDMVPEMNEIAEETSKISLKKGIRVLLLQNIGLVTGITALFILAKYQDNIQF